MNLLEKIFESTLWNGRLFVLLAVIFSMIGSIILLAVIFSCIYDAFTCIG